MSVISTTQAIEMVISKSHYYSEALSKNLINLSALAREIQNEVQQIRQTEVSKNAILAALQRRSKKIQPDTQVDPKQYLSNLTLVSDLTELILKSSNDISNILTQMSKNASKNNSLFFSSTNNNETMVVLPKQIAQRLKEDISDVDLIAVISNLSALSLDRSPGQLDRSGVLFYPIRELAINQISVAEIITAPQKLILIIKDNDIDQAFSVLRKALS